MEREIVDRVTDSSRLEDHGLKAESTSAADYGSAERQQAFVASLATTGANETQVRGRAAAERGEATHPSAAVTLGKSAAKARKTRTGASVGIERAKSGRLDRTANWLPCARQYLIWISKRHPHAVRPPIQQTAGPLDLVCRTELLRTNRGTT